MNKVNYSEKSEELINILENNGKEYYKELCKLKDNYTKEEINKILNNGHYNCYMGHHLHALIYIVGDLVSFPRKGVYGNFNSISNDLGIKILEELVKYNIDLDYKNYYNETPLQNLNSNGYTKRKNNTNFKKKLENYYINRLNKTLIN